jgi:hypothetical protein
VDLGRGGAARRASAEIDADPVPGRAVGTRCPEAVGHDQGPDPLLGQRSQRGRRQVSTNCAWGNGAVTSRIGSPPLITRPSGTAQTSPVKPTLATWLTALMLKPMSRK